MHNDSRKLPGLSEQDALLAQDSGSGYVPPDRDTVSPEQASCHAFWLDFRRRKRETALLVQANPPASPGWDGGVVVRTLSRLSSFATGQKETAELRALRITGTDLDQGLLPSSPCRRPPTPLEQFFEVRCSCTSWQL